MTDKIPDVASPEQIALWKAAKEDVADKSDKVEKEFALSQLHDWQMDQGSGEVTFSQKGGAPRVVAKFVPAGSFSLTSDTWVWAWANDDVEDKDEIGKLYKYGLEKGMRQLTEPQLSSTPEEAFQLASVAAYVLKEGVPIQLSNIVDGDTVGYLYVLLKDIQKVH